MNAASVRYLTIMTATFASAILVMGDSSKTQLLRIVARDYSYQLPSSASAGMVAIRLVNQGTEPHYARVLRMANGKTLQDVMAWRKSGSPFPDWLTRVTGPATTMPGDSTEVAVRLGPGRYVILCTYPSPNRIPHVDLGMIALIDLREDGLSGTEPSASAMVLLNDDTINLSHPLSAGRQVLRVENQGRAVHQLLVARLPPGVVPEVELAWFRGGSAGPSPARPTGGIIELPPGGTVWLSLDLTPGHYLLLCSVPNPDGTRHFDHGMMRQLVVS